MPYKTVLAGQEATADDANDLFMQQVVARFPNAAARATAITAPELNQLSMLNDRPGFVQYWNGGAWVDQAYVPPAPYVPPPDPDPMTQANSSVFTTNVFGGGGFGFNAAFAGAPIITAINGDFRTGTVVFSQDGGNTTTTVGFLVCMRGDGAFMVNTTLRANWIAVGPRP